MLKRRHVEVDQKPHGLASEFHIGKKLRFVNRENLLDGFQFNDNLLFHNEVHLVSTIEDQSFVDEWDGNLPPKTYSATAQFKAKALFVSRFQQTRPHLPMYLNRRADDFRGARISVAETQCWRGENRLMHQTVIAQKQIATI